MYYGGVDSEVVVEGVEAHGYNGVDQFGARLHTDAYVVVGESVHGGVAVGCLLANLFSTVSALDVAVGTAATLLAAFLTSRCKNRFLAPLPPVLCNAVAIGALLAATQSPGAFWQGFGLFAVQVGAGEFAAAYGAGSLLLVVLKRQGLDERLRSIR